MLGLAILFAVALISLLAGAALLLAWEMRHPPRHTAAWAIARGRPCDPADIGLAFEEWSVEVAGAQLPVWEIDAEATRQKKEVALPPKAGRSTGQVTVVMIHGWGESRVHCLSRLEPWVHHTSRIVMYDLRGHGDAEGAASRLGDGEQRDLLEVIDQLGDGPVVLVGWSMGGVIALAAAAEATGANAQRIRGVMTIGAYADFHISLQGRLRVQQLPTRPLTDVALLVQRATGISPPGGATLVRRIQGSVQLVHGEDDAVVPVDQASRLNQLIPDSRLVVIPGGDHCEPREANADQFDGASIEWLGRALSSIESKVGNAEHAATGTGV